MALLANSRRRLLQAVHAKVSSVHSTTTRPTRAWVKWGLVAAAEPTREELAHLGRSVAGRPAAAVVMACQAALSPSGILSINGRTDIIMAFGEFTDGALLEFISALSAFRRERSTLIMGLLSRIEVAYSPSSQNSSPRAVPVAASVVPPYIPAGARLIGAITGLPAGALAYEFDEIGNSPKTAIRADKTSGSAARLPKLSSVISKVTRVMIVYPESIDKLNPLSGRQSFKQLSIARVIEWANGHGFSLGELKTLNDFSENLSFSARSLTATNLEIAVTRNLDHLSNLTVAFSKQMEVEPIGLLHLERLTFTPAGIERGELVYSVPLAPGEQVNLAHKEWATRSDEFEKIVTDVMEEFSEEGVSEKTDLAQTTGSQQQHANSINIGVTASGGYGPVQVTSSLGVNVADSASKTQQFSRNSSQAMTRKASSRSKKEHKFSFKVASASGTEDQSVRRFTNPFSDKATRVDYYQLIRKWEVNVWRYGIRMTYDITIPEPGSDAMGKIIEINALSAALQQGFGADGATLEWARFDLKPQELTPDNYLTHAAEYGAVLPPPPEPFKWYAISAQHQWKDEKDAERNQFFALEIEVDESYAVDDAAIDNNYTVYKNQPADYKIQSTADFFGRSGKCILIYRALYLGSLYVELRVRARLRQEVLQAWQLKAWGAIHDAAQSRFYEQRLLLTDRLARMREELGAIDVLSLRKFEREEVMKGVLRWLFGPTFRFNPNGMPTDLYAANENVLSKSTWSQVLAEGELIKFLQQAIEWENLLYILYPYFWSHLSRWEMKKYLEHPDAMHRAFLKSGAARVVLTIRPGFERDFLSLIETGSLNGLPATHPYLTIVQEMEAYAHTNFPGIPPANPEGQLSEEDGLLVGGWFEYTPTSALDIAFGETMPSA